MKSILFLITLMLTSASIADITTLASSKTIHDLRGEGNLGLVSFSEASICGRRAYMDLNSDIERVRFSLAMMAFSSSKKVSIRVDDNEASKIYGACKIYDILVHN